MQFFVFFVIGAVLLGAGAMLAPAWPTKQPRIGLAATFSLALVSGGAVFWANLFGWDTLVIDYLLFALVSMVVLGGTMAQAQNRAEARGEELLDQDMGWPGPEDLAFFGLVMLLVALPLAIFDFPIGGHAATQGMVTLAARDGGTFDSLAPHYPEIKVFAAPGFHALTAYLSKQLDQPIPTVHLATGAILALLCVWTAYDLGAEIQNKRLGRAMALALIGSLGVANLFLNSYYSDLMGVLFGLAFALFALRFIRHHLLVDMIAAGMMLGAVMLVSPGMFVVTGLSYVFFLLANHLPKRIEKGIPQVQPTWKAQLGRWVGLPLVTLLGTAPWTVTHRDSLEQLISNWLFHYQYFYAQSSIDLLQTQGLWMILLIVVGIFVGWRTHRNVILWGIGWLVFSFWLYPPKAFPIPSLAIPLPNPATPETLAPIIPYAILGGFGLLWLYERIPQNTRRLLRQRVYVLMLVVLLGIVGLWVFSPQIIEKLDDDVQAAVAPGDFAAMLWLAEHAPEDAKILNYPEMHWVAPTNGVLTEFIPNSPPPELFSSVSTVLDTDLAKDDVDYVFVSSHTEGLEISDFPNLEPVFEQDGAVVYRVLK